MKVEGSRGEARTRVVIDTNVWISAALSRDGVPAGVVRRVLDRGVVVFSAETFAELDARLWQPKFDPWLSMELRRRLLHDASAAACWVDIPGEIASRKECRDAEDDKFIHAALAAYASWLVSGDQDLLAVGAIPGLRIASPREALEDAGFCA